MKLKKSNVKYIPVGSFIETESGYFFVFSSSKRYKILSQRVLNSWAPARIIKVNETAPAVVKMKVAAKLKFRNNSLLWSLSDSKLYIIENAKKRHITSPDTLDALGIEYNRCSFPKGVIVVSAEELALHETGQDL